MSALKKLGVVLLGGGAASIYSFEQTIRASGTDADRVAHAPGFQWHFENMTGSLDSRSVRRGYEVYKKVCSSCHGCFTVNFRMLSTICMTAEEAKAEAKRATYIDGPDDTGAMFERPGTMVDYMPEPYPNDAAAAYANGGKAPPNLGLIVRARGSKGKTKYGFRAGHNYVFALLTGYCDPPAGIVVDEGLHFNPYFKGGAIAMAPPLYNGVIEYSDGTPATKSQLAKDVVEFLQFAAFPYHDRKKKQVLKYGMLLSAVIVFAGLRVRRAAAGILASKAVYTKPMKL